MNRSRLTMILQSNEFYLHRRAGDEPVTHRQRHDIDRAYMFQLTSTIIYLTYKCPTRVHASAHIIIKEILLALCIWRISSICWPANQLRAEIYYASNLLVLLNDRHPVLFSLSLSAQRNTTTSCGVNRALFRCIPNSKFFHSLSITSIFSRLHGVLNVGKKNN